jgi:hypothetical protein
MKMEQEKVPQMPRRMPLSEAQRIGVYVRPVKQLHVNFWNLERIGIVRISYGRLWWRKIIGAFVCLRIFNRVKNIARLRWMFEPLATVNWMQLDQFQYFLNEQQAISYAQNMIAQRPNTHERVVGRVIFGSNRVPAAKKDGE